jgi:hypothetical protein
MHIGHIIFENRPSPSWVVSSAEVVALEKRKTLALSGNEPLFLGRKFTYFCLICKGKIIVYETRITLEQVNIKSVQGTSLVERRVSRIAMISIAIYCGC